MPLATPRAVLFACNLNRVRSPMAAALLTRLCGPGLVVRSCGLLAAEEVDPFVVAVMGEVGVDLSGHTPRGFDALAENSFDLVVTLTPEARTRAAQQADGRLAEMEYWPTEDPTLETGSRDQRLEAYRRVRDTLEARVRARFAHPAGGGP